MFAVLSFVVLKVIKRLFCKRRACRFMAGMPGHACPGPHPHPHPHPHPYAHCHFHHPHGDGYVKEGLGVPLMQADELQEQQSKSIA